MAKVTQNNDFYSGLFLLIFSMFFIAVTPSQVPLYEASDALSPRLVPYITLIFIGVLGVIMLLNALFKARFAKVAQDVKHEEEEKVAEKPLEKNLRDLIIFISISVFIIVFAEFIGFTFASMIGLIIGVISFGARSWFKILGVSITVPLIIEFGYRLMGIYLPLGFWEDIIYSIF